MFLPVDSIVAPNLLSDETSAPKRKRLEQPKSIFLTLMLTSYRQTCGAPLEGTIEMVVQPNGRKITPHYNKCGMLMRVELGDEMN